MKIRKHLVIVLLCIEISAVAFNTVKFTVILYPYIFLLAPKAQIGSSWYQHMELMQAAVEDANKVPNLVDLVLISGNFILEGRPEM